MSAKTIYTYFVESGLTPEGACAMLGNLYAESTLKANIVQKGMTTTSDEEYTAAVDDGSYGDYKFAHDSAGYGLAQWTYCTRKAALLQYARNMGESVGDELLQAAFIVEELASDYPSLLSYLKTTTDIDEAASRICKEYERPAVNNIAVRATFAQEFYSALSGLDVSSTDTGSASSTTGETKATELTFADALTNESVMHLQAILATYGYDLSTSTCASGVDGYIGKKTVAALKDFAARLEAII